MKNILTRKIFIEALNEIHPVLYYGTSKFQEKGEIIHVAASNLYPEYIVCHPDDLDEVKSKIKTRILVHISKEPIESVLERMRKNISSFRVT
jgi:hypothetical protein